MKKLHALGVGLALTLGGASASHAGVLATSILDITNFKFSTGGTTLSNVTTANPHITIQSGNNYGTATASLDSVPGVVALTPSVNLLTPAGGQFDIVPICEGTGCPALGNNDYTTLLSPPGSDFARSDNIVAGASIDLDVNGDGVVDILGGVRSAIRSDVSLINTDVGTASSSTGTNTTFDFVASANALIDVTFNYYARVWAEVAATDLAPSTATASTSWSMLITDQTNGGLVFYWAPTQLILNASRSDAATGTEGFLNAGALANNFNVQANTRYQLTISGFSQANAQVTVPEPGSLALLSMGLFGLASATGSWKRRART